MFEEHLSFSAVSNGVKAGRLFQSSLRVNRFNPYEGWVTHSALQKVGAPPAVALLCADGSARGRPLPCDVRCMHQRLSYAQAVCAPGPRPSTMQNVLIKDKLSINRAFDGDSVVVELLPEAQWSAPSTRLPGKDKEHAEEADTDAHIVAVRSASGIGGQRLCPTCGVCPTCGWLACKLLGT